MKKHILLPLLALLLAYHPAGAQLSLSSTGTAATINFTTTVAGVNNGTFAAPSPYAAASPSTGQISSGAWSIVSGQAATAAATIGSFPSPGGFGTSTGGVSSGGVYAFTVATGNTGLGWQPSGSFMGGGTGSGNITLLVTNNTGATLTSLDVSYKIYTNNNEARSSFVNFYYSTNNSSYTNISSLDYTSPVASTGSAWVATTRTTTISSLSIANGTSVYLRWHTGDVAGSGSRDEFALDDISVTGNGAVATGTFTVAGESGLTTLAGTQGSGGTPGSFTLSGTGLTNTVTVAPSNANFEVSTSAGSGFGSSLSFTPSSGGLPGQPVTIYVRTSPTAAVGAVSGTVGITSTGATNATVNVSGTVTGPMLSASPTALSGFNAVTPAASAAQATTISGSNLTTNADISVSGPYEISTDGLTFSTAPISLVPAAGSLNQEVFVRIAAGSPGGEATGTLTVASGALTASVALSGQITQPFSAGNLVIARVGDGAATLVNTGNAVFLDEYTPAGVLVQSIALPTAISGSNKRLVVSGTSTSEGILTRSADGRFLTIAGYDATPPYASLTSSASATVNRTVAVVGQTGYVDLTTALNDFSSAGSPRAAFTTNGTDLWAAGSTGGLRYATKGTNGASAQVSTTLANLRTIGYAELGAGNGQLLVGHGSGSSVTRVAKVGTGTPTTTGNTIDNLPGVSTSAGVYQFFFADLNDAVPGVDVLYTALDAGGVQKYSFDGTTWASNGTIDVSSSIYRGLTGQVSADSVVTLYAVRGAASPDSSQVLAIVDESGWAGAPTAATITPIITKNMGSKQRISGIAMAPVNTACSGNDVVWQGNASADWAFAGNWCGGIPTATSNVLIPGGSQYQPRIVSGSRVTNDLNLAPGMTLTVAGNHGLTIGGTLTTAGMLNAENGALTFNGTASQNIPSLTARDLTFNGSAFTLQGNLTVSNALNMDNGIVSLGGFNITLQPGGSLSGGSAGAYARTNGAGALKAFVNDAGSVLFPVGNTAYNPAEITNDGPDAIETGFSVRVVEEVLTEGTGGTPVTNPVINRTWLIDEDGSGTVSEAGLTLYWNAGEELNDFDYDNVYIAHYNVDNEWENTSGVDADNAPPADDNGGMFSVSVTGLESFSPFAVASAAAIGNPLPVRLSALRADRAGAANRLTWSSLGEEEPGTRYAVQWSADAATFTTLETLQGAGATHDYTWTHAAPASGLNYYRIVATTPGGTTLLTNTASLWNGSAAQPALSIVPNPASGTTRLLVAGELAADASASIVNAAGQTVLHQSVQSASTILNLQGLPAGIYLIRLANGSQHANSRLVIH